MIAMRPSLLTPLLRGALAQRTTLAASPALRLMLRESRLGLNSIRRQEKSVFATRQFNSSSTNSTDKKENGEQAPSAEQQQHAETTKESVDAKSEVVEEVKPPTVEEMEAVKKTVAEKNTKIAEVEKKVAELQDALLRQVADTTALRARHEKELDSSKQYAMQKFAKDMLDTSDVLDMALKAVKKEDLEVENNKALRDLHEGVTLTRNNLLATFKRHGIERFDPTGQKFNPDTMEALFQAPAGQGVEPGMVMTCMKEGFMLKDRVLRAAQVGVVRDE